MNPLEIPQFVRSDICPEGWLRTRRRGIIVDRSRESRGEFGRAPPGRSHEQMTGVLPIAGPARFTRGGATTVHRCDDHALVARVRVGDDRAFEELFERYAGRVTAYVHGMVRDHGRAEDITQEVFFNALRRMRDTERPIAFRPWIYEIARNACIDAHRRACRTQEVSYDGEEGLPAADQGCLVSPRAVTDAVETRESLENLQGALGALSEPHVEVLVLRELEGLSYSEIGERLGMSRSAVESTLFRARKRLEAEYNDLVSGERCRQIQAALASADARPRLRDRRQVARHLAWCQACRREARLAGLDVEIAARVRLRTKVGALVPLPAFLRDRLLVSGATAPGQLASAGDGLLEWGRAAAAAAVIAIAGVGASAVAERGPVVDAYGSTSGAVLSGTGDASGVLRRMSALVGAERGQRAGADAISAVPVRGAWLVHPRPPAPAAERPVAEQRGAEHAGANGSAGAPTRVVPRVTTPAGPAVGGLTGAAGGAARGVGETVRGAVQGVTRTVGDVVREVARNPATTGQAVGDAVRGTTNTADEAVTAIAGTAAGAVRGTTQAAGTVRATPPAVNETVGATTQAVSEAARGAAQGVAGTVQQVTRPASAPQPANPTAASAPVQDLVQDTTQALGGLLGGR
jgi:RNA polymerase sigma factor (sigma-70 family)